MGFIDSIKLFYYYLKPYRKRVILGILSLLAVDIITAYPPILLKHFIDQIEKTIAGDRSYTTYARLGFTYVVIALFQGVFRYGWREFLIKTSHRAAQRIRDDYFSKLQKLPPSFYDRNTIGDLMSLATNDVEAVRFALGPGLLVMADALFILIVTPPAMIYLSRELSFVTLLPLIFIPFVISYAEKKVHERFSKVQEQFSKLTSFAQENIEGIRIIKSFVREWTQLERFGNLGKEFTKLHVSLSKAQAIFEPVFNLGITFSLVALIVYTGESIIGGKIAIGTFVAFTRYLDHLVWPLTAIGLGITYYQRGKGSLARIRRVLAEPEIGSGNADKNGSIPKNKKSSTLLEVTNLTFKYPHSGQMALKNISLKIEKGERVAIVGPVGSGKSTLSRLLCGMYDPEPGMIRWFDEDALSYPVAEKRTFISIVPQDVFLFSDSIEANVFMSVDTESMSKEDQSKLLRESMKRSGLSEEFRSWSPEMFIGERGQSLSGGQKARLTMARAFVRNSPLLILDDALSSVDVETEKKVLDELDLESTGDQALLMITHRYSRLWNFDRIYVLKDGEVVDSGTASELMTREGIFKKMSRLQQMENELL